MTRCGYIAILGAPNAGKSTLVNRMAGGKVSIVSPKVQTTRKRIRGICNIGDVQLVLVDTPGIFDAKRKFEQGMVQEAWAGADEADAALLVVDATKGLSEDTQAIIATLVKRQSKNAYLALNKVDEVQKPYLLKLATACDAFGIFKAIFMISARTGDGVDGMQKELAKLVPEGPWLYPDDQMTDQSMREIAAEITREKLFLLLRQELPYSLAVETEKWEDQKNGTAKIMQVIIVEREGQKKIVIGDNAATLKKIGMSSRRELEAMLGRKVHLELFVKVDERWKDKASPAG